MEDLYGLHSSFSCSEDLTETGNITRTMNTALYGPVDNLFQYESAETEVTGSEMSDLIKTQIANHPLYPKLVSAYIECRKVFHNSLHGYSLYVHMNIYPHSGTKFFPCFVQ